MSRAQKLLPIDRGLPEEVMPGLELTDAHRAHLKIEERFIPGPANQPDVRVVISQPKDHPGSKGEKLPILLHLHGGAFCFMHPETFAGMEANWAQHHNCVVVSVDYRLAPEHPYPAALDDCETVLRWIVREGVSLGGDPTRLAIGGGSAGGNLSAALALKMRDESGPKIAFQYLLVPATDLSDTREWVSYDEAAGRYVLTVDGIRQMVDAYVPDPADRMNPYVSPLLEGDLSGLPPALVVTALFDPLRDQGEAYARRLEDAGNRVELIREDGLHGFLGSPERAKRINRIAAARVREALLHELRP